MKKIVFFLVLFSFWGCQIPTNNLERFETQDFLLETPFTITRNTEIEQQGTSLMAQMYEKKIDLKSYMGSGKECVLMISSIDYHMSLKKDNLMNANIMTILNIDKTQPVSDIRSKIIYHTDNNILYSNLEYPLFKNGLSISINSSACLVKDKIHNVLVVCKDSLQNKQVANKIVKTFKCK